MRARNGSPAVNRDDVLGSSRETNTVMTRCILVSSILDAGYSVSTAAALLGRTARGIRHLLALDRHYWRTSCAYRTAVEEAKKDAHKRNTPRIIDTLNAHWREDLQQRYNDARLELSQQRQNATLIAALKTTTTTPTA